MIKNIVAFIGYYLVGLTSDIKGLIVDLITLGSRSVPIVTAVLR